ncbi:MAG: riboflavin kinase, partial [Eubacteriales bacterium]|nr:riboflavin kinase [Eubacteriales bacterium]
MIFIEPLEKFEVPYVLTVGKFDGMHLGHQAIFRQLTVQGQHCRRVAYVFYFEQESHLSPWEERCALLEAAGAEAVARIPAGHRLWSMEPEAFIRSLCAGDMLRGMVVGSNFRFGRGAQGDTALLKQLGGRYGFAVTVVPPVQAEGGNVSSSAVRAALLAGDLALVTQLLGRPYEMSGVVTAGKQLGRTLGFPTANLPPAPEKLLPPEGVYAAIARVDGRSWAAMTNVGRNPTVNGEH